MAFEIEEVKVAFKQLMMNLSHFFQRATSGFGYEILLLEEKGIDPSINPYKSELMRMNSI